ncbi:MAG TPA: hypothetical protein G4N96_14105 [Chloroflexi bacterium]|nr:hypothetical protein [Chloroflexota bacterium]
MKIRVIRISSEDDPIVSVDDFKALADVSLYLSLHIQRYGGHMGYIDIFPFRRWLSDAIPAIFS